MIVCKSLYTVKIANEGFPSTAGNPAMSSGNTSGISEFSGILILKVWKKTFRAEVLPARKNFNINILGFPAGDGNHSLTF